MRLPDFCIIVAAIGIAETIAMFLMVYYLENKAKKLR